MDSNLQRCRNGDDLLDCSSQAFNVVVPVENFADIEVVHRVVLKHDKRPSVKISVESCY